MILDLAVLLCGEGYFGEQWRGKVAAIVNHQARHLTLTPKLKKQLQVGVQQLFELSNRVRSFVHPIKVEGYKELHNSRSLLYTFINFMLYSF